MPLMTMERGLTKRLRLESITASRALLALAVSPASVLISSRCLRFSSSISVLSSSTLRIRSPRLSAYALVATSISASDAIGVCLLFYDVQQGSYSVDGGGGHLLQVAGALDDLLDLVEDLNTPGVNDRAGVHLQDGGAVPGNGFAQLGVFSLQTGVALMQFDKIALQMGHYAIHPAHLVGD